MYDASNQPQVYESTGRLQYIGSAESRQSLEQAHVSICVILLQVTSLQLLGFSIILINFFKISEVLHVKDL